MCGIAGSLGLFDSQSFQKSLKLLHHRGPDNQSVVELPNLILGHTRLSIRDLSAKSNQPITSDNGSILVYNGEIYNCDELYQYLVAINVSANKYSDTNLLQACLDNFGVERTLSIIHGMFAFAYFEASTNTVFLCRDHLGMKPLYFLYGDDFSLHFSSTIDCVSSLARSSLGVSWKNQCFDSKIIDRAALKSYLSNGYSSSSNTWINGVCELSPGHFIAFDVGSKQLKMNKWFDLPGQYSQDYISEQTELSYVSQSVLSRQNISELNSTLERVVEEHCLSDVGCGLFLSGGLDSSLLASYIPQKANLKAFSIRYLNDPYGDEVAVASKVADKFGIELVTADFDLFDYSLESCVRRILEITKYPFYNITILAQDFLCGLASASGCKVVLTGDGADELFGGYPRYQATLYHDYVRSICFRNPFFLNLLVKSLKGVASFLGPRKANHSGRRISSFADSLLMPSRDLHSLFLENIPSKFLVEYFSGNQFNSFFDVDGFRSIPPLGASLVADMMSFLPWNLLKSSDLSSMYNSIEMRVPFCDRRLLPFSAKMCSTSVGISRTKIPLRKLAQSRDLAFLSSHKKRGFSPPLRALIDNNHDSIRQCFADSTFFSEFIDPDYLLFVERSQFVDGLDYSKQIFSLYMLKYWWDRFVKS